MSLPPSISPGQRTHIKVVIAGLPSYPPYLPIPPISHLRLKVLSLDYRHPCLI